MTHTHEGPAAGTVLEGSHQAHGATPDFWPESPVTSAEYPEGVTLGSDGKPYCPRPSPAPYYLVAMGELVHARNRGEDWRALVEPLRHRCPEGELALFEERVRMMEEADRGS
jgi:hypothetical protein